MGLALRILQLLHLVVLSLVMPYHVAFFGPEAVFTVVLYSVGVAHLTDQSDPWAMAADCGLYRMHQARRRAG
jgi:hypothetical protein